MTHIGSHFLLFSVAFHFSKNILHQSEHVPVVKLCCLRPSFTPVSIIALKPLTCSSSWQASTVLQLALELRTLEAVPVVLRAASHTPEQVRQQLGSPGGFLAANRAGHQSIFSLCSRG